MTDREFADNLNLIRKGDQTGLKAVYEEYMSYIYSVVFSYLNSKEDAEDICSDFFIKLFKNPPDYKPGSGHKGFIATIARNMAIDHMRKRGREDLTEDFEEAGITPDTKSAEDEAVGQLGYDEAIAMLKPPEPEIINMKLMGDLSFKEIAEVLKMPMGTVTWHYRKAIEKLRGFVTA